MGKKVFFALTLAIIMLAGAAYAGTIDSTCTRFLDNNRYSCRYECSDGLSSGECLQFTNPGSIGNFDLYNGYVDYGCSCDNATQENNHGFICVASAYGGEVFAGTVNRSLGFTVFWAENDGYHCTEWCRLDPNCGD